MMHFRRASFLSLTLALACSLVLAADKAEKKPEKKPASPAAAVFAVPKKVTLTAEQQTKVDELRKDLEPKLAEAMQKLDSILTAEQKAARETAARDAKAAGKKGKELSEALNAAVKLTDEQKAQMDTSRKEVAELTKKAKTALMELLTDEQKAELKPAPKRDKKPKTT